MNYRHHFHAGNFADVMKHVLLLQLLTRLNAKDKPYRYVDTHGGAGKYDLSTSEAQKSGEFLNGIHRLVKLDDSVKRFRFKGVAERKSRYSDFDSAITWLEKCRLILKNYPVEGMPRSPLAAYQKENYFKLFMFDIGLLNSMLGISYKEIKQQGFEYKGYLAENFVQQELAASGLEPSHSWFDARAEIEFIVSDTEGNIIPIEVKSGKRTRAKSLQSYITKCSPVKTFKLTATQGSSPLEQTNIVLPLYYAGHLPGLIRTK